MRNRSDRGATLIETGLVLPLLILLALGLSEIGFLIVDYLTVTNAAREGARTGSAAADYVAPSPSTIDADDLILNAVEEAACNLIFGDLQTVTIYRAEPDGSKPLDLNYVRVYNAGTPFCDVAAHNLSCPTCTGTWAPSNRARDLPTPDALGVEVEFSHDSVTGIFPFPTVNWNEAAVMNLEPDVQG